MNHRFSPAVADVAPVKNATRLFRRALAILFQTLRIQLQVQAKKLLSICRPDLKTEHLKPGPFSFGDREFYRRGIDLYVEATRKGYIRSDSLYIWWTRLIIGHRTLLYKLDSNVDYNRIYNEEKTY